MIYSEKVKKALIVNNAYVGAKIAKEFSGLLKEANK